MFRLLLVVSATPPEIPLACFYGADDLKGRVVDLTNQMTWNNKHEVMRPSWRTQTVTSGSLWARMVSVYLELIWRTNITSMVLKMRRV